MENAEINYREKINQIREEMVQAILVSMEKNPVEWESGWNNIGADSPINGKTGKSYRGVNFLYLWLVGKENGYEDSRWVTFNQAKELGASVRKGEKSFPVLFYELYDRKTKRPYDSRTTKDMSDEERAAYEHENVYAVLKYSRVFNAAQCANFPKRDIESLKMSEEDRAKQNALIENIIANSGAPIKYDGGNRAYYSPMTDSIHLPGIEVFHSMQDYYATALHEIAHSTGHESRLNRDLTGKFGQADYAVEELRAELACVFMQVEQGIRLEGKHIENHAAYLNNWLSVVKGDKSIFFKAASDAQKIADYVSEHYLQSEKASEHGLETEQAAQNTAEKSAVQIEQGDHKEETATKLANARAKARQLSEETGEPYVTVEWTEKINGFPDINDYDVMPLSVADEKLRSLDAQAFSEEGYIKTKLHIDFTFEGKAESYENCRFDIGSEGGGLIYHIDENAKSNTFLNDDEKEALSNLVEYFTEHNKISGYLKNPEALAQLTSEEQDDVNRYVTLGREALNNSEPFEDYVQHMPLNPDKTKKARDLAHAAGLPFYEGTVEEFEDFVTGGGYVYDGNMSVEDYQKMWELKEEDEKKSKEGDHKEEKEGSPLYQKYRDAQSEHPNAFVFQRVGDFYEVLGEKAKEVAQHLNLTLTGRDMGLSDRVPMVGVPYHAAEQYIEKLRNYGDVAVETNDGKYVEMKQHREQSKGNGEPDKKANSQTLGAELAESSHWLKVDLPAGSVGKEYGSNTLVRMPEGEYSHFGLFIPTKFLKQTEGKWQLNLGSKFNYHIDNDGRRVELTGQELRDSFAGMQIGKVPVRVAPSKAYAKTYEALEKNVPEEMKALPNWCVYRTWQREDKDKKGKVLKSAVTGEGASSKNPGDWTDFKTAIEYAKKNGFAGVSFLLDAKNGITCIDLDECVKNAETGEMKERAAKLIDGLKGTYMERSTSGNGVHIFIKDDILKNGKYRSTSVDAQKGDLEVYDNQRIISMTGDMSSETNNLTRAGSAATVYLRNELGEQKQHSIASRPQTNMSRSSSTGSLSDGELINWIRGSKKGREFDDLYSGKGISGNKSNDDAKLAHMLLYFSGGDKEQTFRIMRESGCNRSDKPDTYYRHTIDEMDKRIEEYAKRPKSEVATVSSRVSGRNGKKGSGAQA